jgi:capsular polysaccharide biosynthesis protein
MELYTYWRIFARRWWLALLPALVVVAHTAYTWNQPPTVYQAYMNFSAGLPPEEKSESYTYDGYYAWLTSEYVANGLADVAVTGTFARAVSSRLAETGREIPPTAIQPAIVTDNAQSILVVYLTWRDVEQIVVVADAITAELTENGAAYFPQLEGIEPGVRLLDPPAPVSLPPGLRTQLMGPAIKIGLALVVGVALALLWHYLDPTVHEAAELEHLEINVLAEIPRK